MSMISEVNHLKRYPAATLDGRTRAILEEGLRAWTASYIEVESIINDLASRKIYREAFAQDINDVSQCLAELEAVKNQEVNKR